MSTLRGWSAGIWDQTQQNDDGCGLVVWSTHSTQAHAETAARRYARESTACTGGPLSWSGGVRGPDGRVYWLDAHGRVLYREGVSA